MTTSHKRIVEVVGKAMADTASSQKPWREDVADIIAVLESAGYKIVSGEPVAWISPLELQKLKAYGSAIVTPTFKNGLNRHTPLYRESEPT